MGCSMYDAPQTTITHQKLQTWSNSNKVYMYIAMVVPRSVSFRDWKTGTGQMKVGGVGQGTYMYIYGLG